MRKVNKAEKHTNFVVTHLNIFQNVEYIIGKFSKRKLSFQKQISINIDL